MDFCDNQGSYEETDRRFGIARSRTIRLATFGVNSVLGLMYNRKISGCPMEGSQLFRLRLVGLFGRVLVRLFGTSWLEINFQPTLPIKASRPIRKGPSKTIRNQLARNQFSANSSD